MREVPRIITLSEFTDERGITIECLWGWSRKEEKNAFNDFDDLWTILNSKERDVTLGEGERSGVHKE